LGVLYRPVTAGELLVGGEEAPLEVAMLPWERPRNNSILTGPFETAAT
jgi:hypothetical protein